MPELQFNSVGAQAERSGQSGPAPGGLDMDDVGAEIHDLDAMAEIAAMEAMQANDGASDGSLDSVQRRGSADSNAAAQRKWVGPIGSARISAITRAIDAGTHSRKSAGQLKKQIAEWDHDQKGVIGIDEVLAGCQDLLREQEKSQRWKKAVVFTAVMGVIGAIAVFLITKGVVETAKEMHTSSGSSLTDVRGFVIGTAAAQAPLNLADLTRMPIDVFKQVDKLTFRTDSGEHFMQVAKATKSSFGLAITGQDGSTMQCSALQCEVDLAGAGRSERVWVGTTSGGRRLQDHEHPVVDMAFAGYNAESYQRLVAAAVGDPGTLSLERAIPSLATGGCRLANATRQLAERCGLEAGTNLVLNPAGVCSMVCGQAVHELVLQCGSMAQLVASKGRRLAETDDEARTASELLRHVQRFRALCDGSELPVKLNDEGLVEEQIGAFTNPAGEDSITAFWSSETPTSLQLRRDGAPFLTQQIIGLRLLGENGSAVSEKLLFTPENSYFESKETEGVAYLTVYSVLRLGPQSALRVILSQILAKTHQVVRTIQVGPTAACVGRISDDGTCQPKKLAPGHLKFSVYVEAVGSQFALPADARSLAVVIDVRPEIEVSISVEPRRQNVSGAVSLETLRLQRSDGSTIWAYRFDQTYNVDNKRTESTVLVQPQDPAVWGQTSPRSHVIAVRLPIGGSSGALAKTGAFVMYDPETFSGSERLAGSAAMQALSYDMLGIVIEAFIYSKFLPHNPALDLKQLGWLLSNSPALVAGGWQALTYTSGHPCFNSSPSSVYLCETKDGGRFGAAYGRYPSTGPMVGVVAFAGTENNQDVKADLCAGVGTLIYNHNGKECAIGFWTAYNRVRVHFERVLNDFKAKGVEKLVITGHSLGGAIASIATWDLQGLLSGYYWGDRLAATVTIGEPPAWNWPNLAFGVTSAVTETWTTQGRRRMECSGDGRRRDWAAPGCDVQLNSKTTHNYVPSSISTKIHRWVNSVKQRTVQCSWWEYTFTTSILGYTCEQFDWDLVAGVPTLSGNGMHGTQQQYWLGFDASAGIANGDVINLYKEGQALYDYNAQFETVTTTMSAISELSWLTWALSSFVCTRRMMAGQQVPALVAEPVEAPEAAARRLGIVTRISLHKSTLYGYWMARAVCEETGLASPGVGNFPCDCHMYCIGYETVTYEWPTCKDGGGGPYTVCAASDQNSVCSDPLWQVGKCDCLRLLGKLPPRPC